MTTHIPVPVGASYRALCEACTLSYIKEGETATCQECLRISQVGKLCRHLSKAKEEGYPVTELLDKLILGLEAREKAEMIVRSLLLPLNREMLERGDVAAIKSFYQIVDTAYPSGAVPSA